MFNFVLPDWLYRSLPLLYIGSGLGILFAADRGVATVSGALLTLAGLWVLQLRRSSRRRAEAVAAARSTRNLPARPLNAKMAGPRASGARGSPARTASGRAAVRR